MVQIVILYMNLQIITGFADITTFDDVDGAIGVGMNWFFYEVKCQKSFETGGASLQLGLPM